MAKNVLETKEDAARLRVLELEEENRQLRDKFYRLPTRVWRGLTLSQHEQYTLEQLIDVPGICPFERLMLNPEADPEGIRVRIFHLRKQLAALDPPIQIENAHAIGYFLRPNAKVQLLALLDENRDGTERYFILWQVAPTEARIAAYREAGVPVRTVEGQTYIDEAYRYTALEIDARMKNETRP